eukprot:TRINITY_DN41406_c0_g1_i1.p1 TRINITY_DN41406_c0_g1~~TRINITY_DN41406_c0_g1_i1.p1  ORF type:complete len:252 (+),score=24.57 TRINITY_DN41406_c0_g1_i1:55-756(+)
MKAVVIGATSSVGHAIVEALQASDAWESIHLIVRKPIEDFDKLPNAKKLHQRVLPSFDDLLTLQPEFTDVGFDAMFCSLGAYMKIDGIEMTRKVDFEYVVNAAHLAERCGMASFSLVSAQGADPSLPEKGFKGYLRIKGQADEAVLSTKIRSKFIYRPGVLFGRFSAQNTSSVRSKGNWDSMVGCLQKCCCCLVPVLGIHVKALADVMVRQAEAKKDSEFFTVYTNSQILALR